MAKKKDDRVTKRRVTMVSYTTRVGEQGEPITEKHEAVDYVLPEQLDAYVQDARSRWQSVSVSEEPDAGPGGYEGDTASLSHLDAGNYLQQQLAQDGIKPLSDPTNGPEYAGGRLS